MTTPAPERSSRKRSSSTRSTPQARLRLGAVGWTISWLLPTAIMGGILLGLSFVPGLDGEGYLTPLIPLVAAASVVIGIPGTLLVGWLYRHHTQPMVHILGYVVVGLLYGPVVLIGGAAGLMPMLIPLVGFPAGILLGLVRWAVQPLSTIEDPSASAPESATEEESTTTSK